MPFPEASKNPLLDGPCKNGWASLLAQVQASPWRTVVPRAQGGLVFASVPAQAGIPYGEGLDVGAGSLCRGKGQPCSRGL